jgi:hypothetical protein
MVDSEFLIQVVHKTTGAVVSWEPGREVEYQFETELLSRVAAKGVGMARTTTHVLDDVRTALRELLYDLKRRV